MKKRLISAFLTITIVLFLPCLVCSGEAKEKRLVLSTMNWEPYYAEHLPDGGPFAEITKEAFHQAGYTVDIEFLPWQRAMILAKGGAFDGLLGAYCSEERTKHFTYTEKLIEAEIVLASRKGSRITYSSLDDLKPYVIGVLRGGAVTREFDNAHYLTEEEVTKHEQNIKKLLAGRVDLIVLGKYHLLQLLNDNYPDWSHLVEIVEPPLKVTGLFNAISKENPDHKKIASNFNIGLQKIRENGLFGRILKKHGLGEYH